MCLKLQTGFYYLKIFIVKKIYIICKIYLEVIYIICYNREWFIKLIYNINYISIMADKVGKYERENKNINSI